jgi:hypothetical protein
MLKNVLQIYIDEASDNMDIGVVVDSLESGKEYVSYDVVAFISDYGELMISVAV